MIGWIKKRRRAQRIWEIRRLRLQIEDLRRVRISFTDAPETSRMVLNMIYRLRMRILDISSGHKPSAHEMWRRHTMK